MDTFIEDLAKKINIELHFPKVTDSNLKEFQAELGKQFKDEDSEPSDDFIKEALQSFMFSGSFMEGAMFSRNINPNVKPDYFEAEFDMMFPMGDIVPGKAQEIIQNLDYAKGFLWLKYDAECIDVKLSNGKQIEDYLYDYNGEMYLHCKAFKENCNLSTFPNLDCFERFEEEFHGPSNNIDAVMSIKKMIRSMKATKKSNLTKAVLTLDKCLGLFQRAVRSIVTFRKSVITELAKFEEVLNNGEVAFNGIDFQEVAYITLPTIRDQENLLLKIHWSMLAMVNEIVAVIDVTHRLLSIEDFQSNIGFWELAFLPLLKHAINMGPKIFNYLLFLYNLPQKVYEEAVSNPKIALQTFLQACCKEQPKEIEEFLHTLQRCLTVLGPRFHILQAIAYDWKVDEICENVDDVCLNIDRVPAMFIPEWPPITAEYITRHRKWPSDKLMSKIFEEGVHIVPKPYNGIEKNEDLDWRWSFTSAEMQLANARTNQMNLAYLSLKTLFYIYFKAVECDEQTLPSYFAKTLIMWQCEEVEEEWWDNESLLVCITVLLQRLRKCFYDKNLPHYFIRDINLFDNISEDLITYGTAIIESICFDPAACIKDTIIHIVEWQSSQKKKRKDKEEPIGGDVSNSTDVIKDEVGGKPTTSVIPSLESSGAKDDNENKKEFTSSKEQDFLGRDFDKNNLPDQTNIPLLIAEFKNALEVRERKFKDIPEKQGAIKMLRMIYEEQIPDMWPELFNKSLDIKTEYDQGKISFDIQFIPLQRELTSTCITRLIFKGSKLLTFELIHNG